MTKKDYLMKLLDAVGTDVLPIGKDLLFLIENDRTNDAMIEMLYAMFHEYAKKLTDGKQKEIAEKSMEYLEKLKKMEEQEKEKNEKEIEELDAMIAKM